MAAPGPIPAPGANPLLDPMRLRNEYRMITQASRPTSPQEVEETHVSANLPQNRPKNRYSDVLPVETTRVKLSDMHDNYINANFVQSENRFVAICTQAPLPHTFQDFWRMVWEQKVAVIVILMRLRENGKVKGHHYWPTSRKQPKSYGDITVSLKKAKQVEQTRVRVFQMIRKGEPKPRRLVHLHFKGWPDQGVPDSTQPIRELVHLMQFYRERGRANNLGGPVLIHCSAGIGRTGTFLAIVFALEKLLPHRQAELVVKPQRDKNKLHPNGDESSSDSNSNVTSDNTDTNDSEDKDKKRKDTQAGSDDENASISEEDSAVAVVYSSDEDDATKSKRQSLGASAAAGATSSAVALTETLIPDIVLSLRKQRNRGMVQTEDQYHFIYRAVLDELNAVGKTVSETLKTYMDESRTQNDIGILKKQRKPAKQPTKLPQELARSGSSAKSSSSGGSFDALNSSLNSSGGSSPTPQTSSFTRAGSVGGGGATTASNWRKKSHGSRDNLKTSSGTPRGHVVSDDEAIIDEADQMEIDSDDEIPLRASTGGGGSLKKVGSKGLRKSGSRSGSASPLPSIQVQQDHT